MIVFGSPGSGKKTLTLLYAKNFQSSITLHSFKLPYNDHLSNKIEPPFKKYSGINKYLLKPHNSSKKVLIVIEDICL